MRIFSRDTKLAFRSVQRSDWPWIEHWHRDPIIDRALGPMDKKWLEYVLSDRQGVQLVAEEENQPVAMIGVAYGQMGIEPHGITDLVVLPELRKQGLGRDVVSNVVKWDGHPFNNIWIAYVTKGNKPATELIKSLGWREVQGNINMRKFELKI